MSSEQILIPDIGDFESVDVIEVLVNIGDSIEYDMPLITVESDKASMDIPAPKDGVIKDIKIKVGDKVKEGSLIGMIEVTETKSDVKSEIKSPAKDDKKEDIEKVANFSIEYLLKNRSQQLIYRIITKNNELKYISEKRNVNVDNNRIVSVIGTAQDITESVLSEEKLSITKNLLSDTISSIKSGFVLLDANSNYTYINNII